MQKAWYIVQITNMKDYNYMTSISIRQLQVYNKYNYTINIKGHNYIINIKSHDYTISIRDYNDIWGINNRKDLVKDIAK